MKIDMNGLIYSLSYALDCIEAEFVGVSPNHAKWVAYISILMGKELGLSEDELLDLAACAALHDNALTQYFAESKYTPGEDVSGLHCSMGQANLQGFPFRGKTDGFILYHHENADGSGPFGKRLDEIPLQAQIIHLADMLDAACDFHIISEETYGRMMNYLNLHGEQMFSPELREAFTRIMPQTKYLALKDENINILLIHALRHTIDEYPFEQVKSVMAVFGKIVDFKSPFTRSHSERIAEKIARMAKVYGYDSETSERLYVAGVLHDIGKMAVNNDILEKPDKLTENEFAHMKNHAWYTYIILKEINGFEDITLWAANHHEKLNGKGYPFGKTADRLSEKERLLGCIDIYQALSEDRPYKPGMPHEKCMEIMGNMAKNGFIDERITEDIGRIFG